MKPFEKFGNKPNAKHSKSGFAHTLLASKFLEQKNYFSPTKRLDSANQAKTLLFFSTHLAQGPLQRAKNPLLLEPVF